MASKLTLIDISSGFKGTDIQTNFTSIEDEFDDTLSRSGKSPNTMNAELDMNSNKIRNLAQAANNSDAATLKDVLDQTTEDATSKPATAITVSDSGGYYSSSNVEGALQELFDIYFTNVTGAVTATQAELNITDGLTATTSELNTLDGITATTAELNLLDGVTATTAELNKVDADTSGGGFLLGPTSSSDPGLAFDTWRTPNSDRATWVTVEIAATTDGSTKGEVSVSVDEDGGTTADYSLVLSTVASDWSSGSSANLNTTSFLVPQGGSYIINNDFDPQGFNAINEHHEFTL